MHQANTSRSSIENADAALVVNKHAKSKVLLVCEHASNHIPGKYNGLGLSADNKKSHAAWDIGALGIATQLSTLLDAQLVYSTVSRLVYDCNRPPEAIDAMPAKSEQISIPGNYELTAKQRSERIETVYLPFKTLLNRTLKSYPVAPILFTIHSFTPIYYGQRRKVEIGVIHHTDDHLARQMVSLSSDYSNLVFAINEPYSKSDGVTHTLELHGTQNGLTNVMLEIRNDLIETETQQRDIAKMLAKLLTASLIAMSDDITLDAKI